jgi:hypothetical protein
MINVIFAKIKNYLQNYDIVRIGAVDFSKAAVTA